MGSKRDLPYAGSAKSGTAASPQRRKRRHGYSDGPIMLTIRHFFGQIALLSSRFVTLQLYNRERMGQGNKPTSGLTRIYKGGRHQGVIGSLQLIRVFRKSPRWFAAKGAPQRGGGLGRLLRGGGGGLGPLAACVCTCFFSPRVSEFFTNEACPNEDRDRMSGVVVSFLWCTIPWEQLRCLLVAAVAVEVDAASFSVPIVGRTTF